MPKTVPTKSVVVWLVLTTVASGILALLGGVHYAAPAVSAPAVSAPAAHAAAVFSYSPSVVMGVFALIPWAPWVIWVLIHRGFTIKLGEFETKILQDATGYLDAVQRFEDVDLTELPTDGDDLERIKLAPVVQAAEVYGILRAKIEMPDSNQEKHQTAMVALFYRLGIYYLTGFRRNGDKALLWRSIFLFRRALEHDTTSYRARNALGAALTHTDDLSKAEEHLAIAASLPDAGPEAWFHRSIIFSVRRQSLADNKAETYREEELKCLLAALKLDDDHYETNYNISTVHAEKGEVSSAYRRLEKSFKLNEGRTKQEVETDRPLFCAMWNGASGAWQQKFDALCQAHNIRGFGDS